MADKFSPPVKIDDPVLAKAFRDVYRHINRGLGGGETTITVVSSSGGGTGGGTTFTNYRRKSGVAVVEGSNTITFDTPADTSAYTLFIRVVDSANDAITYRETSRSINGFVLADVYSAGTLEYIAIW